ncbi:C39 family peptidase [Anaeromicropila herbilytica]|uniref:Peptidase C39-like domain-containing protein n=1 Tax=Anaeromicropila herbilytica TaxID=2785025 RepID=A0A7R7EHX6_9FIRM|nr:C39 family peptidase [Anaeromicropila herbilytica]BCN29545.1 hypothetical protein bsdtb5_08400 [Anaeromicropila herbilytica]
MQVELAIKAAKVAFDNLTDEKKRRRLLIIILTPIISCLFLFSIVVYFVTSPIDALLHGFGIGGSSYSSKVNDFKNIPEVGDYEENYNSSVNGATVTGPYKKQTIKSGETEVVYYNQGEKPWSTMLYGTLKTIAKSGCGPTSMAIVISTFTGKEVTPKMTADWSYQNGYLVQGYNNGVPYAMSSHALVPALAKEYGLSCEGIAKGNDTADKIVQALSEGKLIVVIMGPGHFTSGGHFIVLRGVTKEGKVLVADCASRSRTNKEWDIATVVNESRNGAGAGGPFWAISN